MSITSTAVVADLIEIIKGFKGADFIEPKGAMKGWNFFDDVGLDSLEVINLLFQVEQKYGVQIRDEDIKQRNLMVVGNMADFIAEKK